MANLVHSGDQAGGKSTKNAQDLSDVLGGVAELTALTDSTGGTAGNTVANLADGTTYANDHAAIENNFASLTKKINDILSKIGGN